ncbi:hypothetical protein C5S32_03320 [ANME-1 cluster archaeon GoMg1]|nr:hypothetical protein [ANME-1 cluster archaeon GoMg1]
MRDKILLKILAISFVLLMVVSCITSGIGLDNLTNNTPNHSDEINNSKSFLTLEAANITEIPNKSISTSASIDSSIRWLGQSISLDEIAWKPDGSYGLIVGYGNIVLKYDGSDFTVLNTSLGFDPYDVEWKPDGSYALIVGSGGMITKYDETSFTVLVSPTTNNLNKIAWKSDGSYALIVGASGTILKYDGSSFTIISSDTTANLNAINWDVSCSNALIVGDSGTVLKYDAITGTIKWLGQTDSLDEIAWKPDGSYSLIGGYDNQLLSMGTTSLHSVKPTDINVTFGKLNVHSEGVNGELLDSYVRVYNQTTGASAGSGWIGSDGVISFYLAPGIYKAKVEESNYIWKHRCFC